MPIREGEENISIQRILRIDLFSSAGSEWFGGFLSFGAKVSQDINLTRQRNVTLQRRKGLTEYNTNTAAVILISLCPGSHVLPREDVYFFPR